MHRRLLKPLAAVIGAAALMVAPIALMAPAQAAPIVLDESNTDDTVPFINGPSPTGTNHVAYWVNYLAGKGIAGATCVKSTPSSDTKTWVIPAAPAGTQYALVTTKAGSQNALEEGQNANLVWWAPKAAQGNTVTAVDGKDISHVIWCTIPKTTTTTTPPVTTSPPVTTPPVTGPVVETDRVADTGPAAGLGLAAVAAALVAAAGAMVFGRRRQGNHR